MMSSVIFLCRGSSFEVVGLISETGGLISIQIVRNIFVVIVVVVVDVVVILVIIVVILLMIQNFDKKEVLFIFLIIQAELNRLI